MGLKPLGEILNQDLTRKTQPDSITPSTITTRMETESDTSSSQATNVFLSNDPRYTGRPDTPPPVICEFCGAERYTRGFDMMGLRVFWFPGGAQPCTCPEGVAKHEQEEADRAAKKEAERTAEEAYKMRERVKRVIGNSGMGERFLQRTFDTFITDTPDKKKIKSVAQTYAQNFDTQVPKRGQPLPGRNGFVISGTKGTGKTHIAAAIANDLLQRGTSVICMTERNLFGRIKRTFNRDEHSDESAVRRVYETVPLLIIDDLGKEKPTEWTLSTLYAIIDGRYDRAMPLIITTNYDMKSLVKKLTPDNGDEITADAIVDRLNEMCKLIIINGDSWRAR